MQIERQSVTGAEVLAVQGQLDATTAPQLEGALEDAADYGNGQPLIVDLAGVGLISSAALRVLLSAAKRARKESGKIHLCAANSEVRKVFEISGLAALFDLHDTREAALAATGAVTAAEPAPSVMAAPLEAEPPPVTAFEAPMPMPMPAAGEVETEFTPAVPAAPPMPEPVHEPEPPVFIAPPLPAPPTPPPVEPPMTFAEPVMPPPPAAAPPLLPTFTPAAPAPPPPVPPVPVAFAPVVVSETAATAPPPPRARAVAAPPPPAPARVPTRTPAAVSAPARKSFPLLPILAGVLGLGLVVAAAGYFLFNRFAPKTGLAEVTPAPTAAPEQSGTPAPEPSIVMTDPTPVPEPSAATPAAPESSPTPTPTPALVGPASATPTPTPSPSANPAGGGDANRVAAPTQVNFDPADPRNFSVRESVLKRIQSMPVSQKVKDQLYAALERARGMGRLATITFGTGRTDLSGPDVETLRKALAQPVTAKLTSDPTVVIVVLGYADTKGDAAANRKLSEQRAQRTLDALKGPCGLMNITHSIGMGPSELLDGKNAEANRAVEVWAVQP